MIPTCPVRGWDRCAVDGSWVSQPAKSVQMLCLSHGTSVLALGLSVLTFNFSSLGRDLLVLTNIQFDSTQARGLFRFLFLLCRAVWLSPYCRCTAAPFCTESASFSFCFLPSLLYPVRPYLWEVSYSVL